MLIFAYAYHNRRDVWLRARVPPLPAEADDPHVLTVHLLHRAVRRALREHAAAFPADWPRDPSAWARIDGHSTATRTVLVRVPHAMGRAISRAQIAARSAAQGGTKCLT